MPSALDSRRRTEHTSKRIQDAADEYAKARVIAAAGKHLRPCMTTENRMSKATLSLRCVECDEVTQVEDPGVNPGVAFVICQKCEDKIDDTFQLILAEGKDTHE